MDLGWGQAFSSNISTPLKSWQGRCLCLVSGFYCLRPLDQECISENTSFVSLFLIEAHKNCEVLSLKPLDCAK